MSQQMQLHFGEVGQTRREREAEREAEREGNTPTGLAFFVSKANTEKRERTLFIEVRGKRQTRLA